ncbi:MAG: GspE/PulE family protein [Synergistes jonesii]|uniref:GspE/PulE family protein n=1 Tax=Synergistes jonesii TaxID=2754 RepID=UPI002A755970|nr:GspE/PulE family protein [Synergistes jonesii]MDY2984622.1 GspE/PulE family protein [Synergistes jonesii]
MTESLKELGASPEKVLDLIPEGVSLDALRDRGFVPISFGGGVMTFAASDYSCAVAAQLLAASAGASAEVRLFAPAEIQNLIRALYDIKSGVGEETLNAIEEIDDLSELVRQEVMSDSADAPVVKLVNGILMESLRERATDIHIEPYEDRVAVRYRIDGVLSDRYMLSKGHQAPVTSRVKVMANMDIAERFVPQDGRIGISLGSRLVDIRVSSLPTQHGERLVLRLLDKARGLLTLEDLGMKAFERERMEELIRRPNGMILFTGPTGSGKSTSLYAILQRLARPQVNVITVEDPIEYDLPGVGQVQVNEKAGLTFANALRSILRQDPDIIMIGEMRDFDTAHIGIQASLTGHLVFSTLHTNDSISAVTRLADMGVEPYLIAGSLLGVVAQRLVRRICPHCKKEIETSGIVLKGGVTKAWRGEGCDYCGGSGYRGRFGLYEQFDVTPEIQEAISRGAPAHELRELARKGGFATLLELGLRAVSGGETTPEEMLRVVGEA